jgi:hypothetical protein
MRYRLRTLMLLTAVAPPLLAALWFYWWPLLLVTTFIALALAACLVWVLGCLTLARWLADLLWSPLG